MQPRERISIIELGPLGLCLRDDGAICRKRALFHGKADDSVLVRVREKERLPPNESGYLLLFVYGIKDVTDDAMKCRFKPFLVLTRLAVESTGCSVPDIVSCLDSPLLGIRRNIRLIH